MIPLPAWGRMLDWRMHKKQFQNLTSWLLQTKPRVALARARQPPPRPRPLPFTQVAFGVLMARAGLDLEGWGSHYRSPYWYHDFAVDFSSGPQIPPGQILVAPLQFLFIEEYHVCHYHGMTGLVYQRLIAHNDGRCYVRRRAPCHQGCP